MLFFLKVLQEQSRVKSKINLLTIKYPHQTLTISQFFNNNSYSRFATSPTGVPTEIVKLIGKIKS